MLVRVCGKEIRQPVLRVFIGALIVLFFVVFLPILIPWHCILRLFGLKGLYFNRRVFLDKESFERLPK